MHKKIILLFGILACFFAGQIFAVSIIAIKVPVANVYNEPNDSAKLATQAIYGDQVVVLQGIRGWTKIKMLDDYDGWIRNEYLGKQDSYDGIDVAKVTNLFAYVYKEPRDSLYPPLFMVPFGAKFPLTGSKKEKWLQVRLVDGGSAWISEGDVAINPELLSMSEMLEESRRFVGLSYLWAGTSTFGFDCSGFVQFLYKMVGIQLPRDANLQVIWPRFFEAKRENLKPGDVLFFGWDKVISHAGVYLGGNKFINSTAFQKPTVCISDLRTPHWRDLFITARRLDPDWDKAPSFQGNISDIPDEAQDKMKKYTWRDGCPTPISALDYLKISYWGFDDKPHQGVLIVNKDLAADVLQIFQELYSSRFPIEKIKPIEEYQGDDVSSMKDNNTSAFNCRAMSDFKDQYSAHSYGAAIDINPLINPYVNGDKIEPEKGRLYVDRAAYGKGKITAKSAVYEVFKKHGWVWGGDWSGRIKDYQHFEKISR